MTEGYHTEGYHTVSDFLRTYAIGRTTLYRLAEAGKIRITKIGRASRIAKADAKAWADSLPTIGGEA